MERITWKQGKLSYLKLMYGGPVGMFADHDDDRQLYVNTYNQIIEAVESMPDTPNNYVAVALNAKIRRDLEMLDRIQGRFLRGDAING